MDLDVHPGEHGYTLRPQKNVAVRQRNPKVVLGQTQQDRVVENTPVRIGDQNIFTLPHGHLGQVPRREHLHKLCSVRAGDLNLPLNSHITQDRIVHEVPKVLFGITKVTGNIHMIINRKTLCTPPHGRIKERGFSDLRAKAKVVCLCHIFALIAGGLTGQMCL